MCSVWLKHTSRVTNCSPQRPVPLMRRQGNGGDDKVVQVPSSGIAKIGGGAFHEGHQHARLLVRHLLDNVQSCCGPGPLSWGRAHEIPLGPKELRGPHDTRPRRCTCWGPPI
jgi:hypothetical protein